MESWDRVLIYGTYDGFVRSTVDPLKIAVRLDDGERVEVPSECVISADQIVKKDEIKLKEVIERIKGFEFGTQVVWISQILDELGSDYGLAKYKAGYEQGKFDGAMGREKVTVPHFIAEYIEFKKKYDFHVYGAMREIEDHYDKRVPEWFYEKNVETFVRAWLDGYTVEEKEKRYYVRFKFIEDSYSYLTLIKHLNAWTLTNIKLDKKFRSEHTRKQLEEAGFGWVFSCEGVEVEEVK